MSKASNRVKDWRKRTKSLIVESMGGQCQICGYHKCHAALELHHLDPSEKEFGFGGLRANIKSFDTIKQELKKCILLCSNCHKEVHAGATSLPANYVSFDETLFVTERDKIKHKVQNRVKVRKDRRKILLTNEEIQTILVTQFDGNKSEMARHYGVSETSIRKRMRQ